MHQQGVAAPPTWPGRRSARSRSCAARSGSGTSTRPRPAGSCSAAPGQPELLRLVGAALATRDRASVGAGLLNGLPDHPAELDGWVISAQVTHREDPAAILFSGSDADLHALAGRIADVSGPIPGIHRVRPGAACPPGVAGPGTLHQHQHHRGRQRCQPDDDRLSCRPGMSCPRRYQGSPSLAVGLGRDDRRSSCGRYR